MSPIIIYSKKISIESMVLIRRMNSFLAVLTAIIVISFVAMSSANAVLIEVDTDLGAGTGTVDTDTNFEWLDVNLTPSLSYLEVVTETGAGGMFDGY